VAIVKRALTTKNVSDWMRRSVLPQFSTLFWCLFGNAIVLRDSMSNWSLGWRGRKKEGERKHRVWLLLIWQNITDERTTHNEQGFFSSLYWQLARLPTTPSRPKQTVIDHKQFMCSTLFQILCMGTTIDFTSPPLLCVPRE
jgi:hypothetical protein